jgi:ribosomal protein S18 acetylase RimI-like enzyme
MPKTSHNRQALSLKNRLKLRNIEFLWDLEEPLPKARSKSKAVIRAASPKDRERLRKIVVEAYLPEWSWWVRQIGGEERARADLMSYVGEFLQDRNKRIFVAEDGEKIIGFCGAAKYSRGTGTIGYGVAVLPGFRKRGIGSMLLLAALDWLKKSRVRFVTLEEETFSFANKDSPAIFLYKSLGGKIIGDQVFFAGTGMRRIRRTLPPTIPVK